jgi:hypothetical protein
MKREEEAMQLQSPRGDVSFVDRRRSVRYPCIARVRTDTRGGMTMNMSPVGLSFHTLDQFTVDEIIDLGVDFEIARDSAIQVMHVARVVRIALGDRGRAWQVGIEFLH